MTTPETAQLLERLRVAVNADHRRRRRRRAIVAAALALAAVSGGAFAAATQAPWWQGGSPPVDPEAVVRVARDNLPASVDTARARTVARSDGAALVAVPINESGYCLIPSLGGRANIGAHCLYQVVRPERRHDDILASYARPPSQGSAAWIVYGRITDPRAAALDLGAFTVELEPGGFFVAEVPQELWSALAGKANAGSVLDAAGSTLRAGCVNWGPSPASPGAGLGKTPLWREGIGRCRPQAPPQPPVLELDDAQKLVELTLAADFSIWKAGTTIALWEARAEDGRVCVYAAAASPAPSGTSRGLPGGGSCRPPDERRDPLERPFEGMSFSVGPGGLITGRVNPSSGIVDVVLRSASGSTSLPTGRGWFLGQLPAGGTQGELPPGGPFVVVGYDAQGREVGDQSLEEIKAAATPPSG